MDVILHDVSKFHRDFHFQCQILPTQFQMSNLSREGLPHHIGKGRNDSVDPNGTMEMLFMAHGVVHGSLR